MNNIMQGPQGVPGLQGIQGIQGVAGPQGIPGQTGMQGPSGNYNNSFSASYANIYSNPPQSLDAFGGAKDTVLFQAKNGIVESDFDLSSMEKDGTIKFLRAGTYRIHYDVKAKVSSPVPSPVPSFGFGLWKNGTLVNGSSVAGYTQSPDSDTLEVSNEVILDMVANDVIKLRNGSSNPVNLNPNSVGIKTPVVAASMNINLLK